jgi:signal transduction histidine kinase/ligand-binding sensor domain-containing protein/DNA-binding response OmpR family regulator
MAGYLKIISLYIFFPILINAQTGNIKFEHLSVEEGLSATTVLSILQDSRGFLWIGTYDGLNRYDGYSIKVYYHDPDDSTSLSSSNIRCLYEDNSDNLWVGTWSSGLNKYDREKDRFTHYLNIPGNPTSLSSNIVLSICQDKNNDLWIGTADGLNRYDAEEEQFIHYKNDPEDTKSISNNVIYSVFEDNSDMLWIGTSKGLNKFNVQNGNFIRYDHNPDDPFSLSNNAIFSICEDNRGELWMGVFGGGLYRFNKEKEQFIQYRNDPEDPFSLSEDGVFSVYEDNRGDLWIGTYGSGLHRFDRKNERFIHYIHNPDNLSSLSDNSVCTIYEDNSGILWIGTWSGGVNKYDRGKEKFAHYSYLVNNPNSLNNNRIRSICEDSSGIIWIGTDGGGLNRFDKEREKFTYYKNNLGDPTSLGANGILSVYVDNYGVLWIGTDRGGLNKFDSKKEQFVQYRHNPDDPTSLSDDAVSVVYEDKTGTLWVGTSTGGLNKFDRKKEQFVQFIHNTDDSSYLSQGKIYSIYEDSHGLLWIGIYGGGLCRFDPEKEQCKHYTNSPDDLKSLSNNFVSSIYEDNSGVLWVGTEAGLNRFDRKNERFFCYRESDGLPNDMICGILEDDHGNLWVSTNNGISKFNPVDITFQNYNVNDGLQSNEFNQWAYYKTKNGEILFGGNNGFNIFHPDSLKDNPFIPPVVITEFQLLHKPVHVGFNRSINRSILKKSITETEEIELRYDDNVISFELSALDFHIPEKNQYAYIMEGFDNEWTYTDASRRFVNYTNLDPGKYIFKVKGSNNDGVWNEKGTSLRIIITPPWWLTWWAYLLYGVFVILIFSTSTRFYINRQRLRHQLELEHEHSEKLEEVDQIKSRFFANISHEFRTPLTLILGPSESIIAETFEEKTKKKAGSIKRNANRLLNLINQLLDLSKLEAGRLTLETSYGNIVTFTKGVAMSFESLAERKDIVLKIKSASDEIELYFDKEKMEKVFINLLANAFKFTPGGSKITISVSETDNNFVEIKIKDTGIGIPEEELPKLFDRFYQVDSSHTRERGGTGLGLALAKELVELHLGSIKVESEEKKWTEVTVSLPLGKEHLLPEEILVADEPLEEIKILVEEEGESTSLQVDKPLPEDIIKYKTIILVVEDNADVREYIKDSLVNEYYIEEAANGEQGLRKAEKIIPDLIISDIMMPKMDGNELTRRLKNDERTSHIPIILLTAKSEQESKLEGLETGADAYLTKPFDIKELQIRIKNLINLRRKLQQKFSHGKIVTIKGKKKKLSSLDEKFMKKALEVIEKNISEETFSIEDFGKEVGMSRMQIHRKLKALTGKSASHYIRSVKLFKAKEIIVKHEATISEIAYSLGFSSPAYFTRCFKEEYGHPPSDLVD